MPTRPAKPSPHAPRYAPPPGAMHWKNPNPEVVDPRWIFKALAAVVAFALGCAYILLCVVFSHTQWQYVLHPSRTISATPAIAGLQFAEVHFGDDSSGQPQLDGWWIPSDSPSDPAALLLHTGDGSISDAIPLARELHDVRLNVLLFDYRGFGRSGGRHPTQSLMQADAESALAYLTGTRGLSPHSILVYGTGAGASLAVNLCAQHPEISALILESPAGDFKSQLKHDERVRLIPVSLLFHQDFPLAQPLQALPTPKLLISIGNAPPPPFQQAADPKMTVELQSTNTTTARRQALLRFLDSYLSRPPATLTPPPQ